MSINTNTWNRIVRQEPISPGGYFKIVLLQKD